MSAPKPGRRASGWAARPADEVPGVSVEASHVAASFKVQERIGKVRLLIDHKRLAWGYRLSAEQARRLAAHLVDAAAEAEARGRGEHESEVGP